MGLITYWLGMVGWFIFGEPPWLALVGGRAHPRLWKFFTELSCPRTSEAERTPQTFRQFNREVV